MNARELRKENERRMSQAMGWTKVQASSVKRVSMPLSRDERMSSRQGKYAKTRTASRSIATVMYHHGNVMADKIK